MRFNPNKSTDSLKRLMDECSMFLPLNKNPPQKQTDFHGNDLIKMERAELTSYLSVSKPCVTAHFHTFTTATRSLSFLRIRILQRCYCNWCHIYPINREVVKSDPKPNEEVLIININKNKQDDWIFRRGFSCTPCLVLISKCYHANMLN